MLRHDHRIPKRSLNENEQLSRETLFCVCQRNSPYEQKGSSTRVSSTSPSSRISSDTLRKSHATDSTTQADKRTQNRNSLENQSRRPSRRGATVSKNKKKTVVSGTSVKRSQHRKPRRTRRSHTHTHTAGRNHQTPPSRAKGPRCDALIQQAPERIRGRLRGKEREGGGG